MTQVQDDEARALLASTDPGQGPPLLITAEGIAQRGARIRRRRRQTAAAGTALGVCALLIGLLLALGTHPAQQLPPANPGPSSPQPVSTTATSRPSTTRAPSSTATSAQSTAPTSTPSTTQSGAAGTSTTTVTR
ncbi:hypothetical protein GCM10010174_86900 [Kutzneria viridogrisea]